MSLPEVFQYLIKDVGVMKWGRRRVCVMNGSRQKETRIMIIASYKLTTYLILIKSVFSRNSGVHSVLFGVYVWLSVVFINITADSIGIFCLMYSYSLSHLFSKFSMFLIFPIISLSFSAVKKG